MRSKGEANTSAMRNGLRAMLFLSAGALLVALPTGAGAKAPPAASQPAAGKNRAAIAKRFDFLSDVYLRHVASPDPITRSIAAISLSRMPSPKATEALLGRLRKDRDPILRGPAGLPGGRDACGGRDLLLPRIICT